MKVEFRPAVSEDAPVAVPLIYSSGPAVLEYAFTLTKSRSALGFLEYGFRDGAGEIGYRNHIAAVHDGQVVGVGACFSGDSSFRFLLSGIRQVWSHYGVLRSPAIIRRALKMESLIKPPDGTMHYIGHLGVPREWRGRGIGRQLVEHFLDIGRHANRPVAVLDVSVENERAQSLYEHIGFRVTEELQSTLPGVPDHRRMEMRI
ncbi:MAG: GNAT family N-acetyltransferase [Planctomycetaceae bacterium]|nr:GNAT family N-acetyltransferase [Planctomycetaceae bacterium]